MFMCNYICGTELFHCSTNILLFILKVTAQHWVTVCLKESAFQLSGTWQKTLSQLILISLYYAVETHTS